MVLTRKTTGGERGRISREGEVGRISCFIRTTAGYELEFSIGPDESHIGHSESGSSIPTFLPGGGVWGSAGAGDHEIAFECA